MMKGEKTSDTKLEEGGGVPDAPVSEKNEDNMDLEDENEEVEEEW